MSYLRGFVPWLVFAGVSAIGWQWGALAGLLACVVLLTADRAAGFSLEARLLEYGTLLYFAALSVLAFTHPDSALKAYSGALSMGWLALVSWASIAVRRPFTVAIARRMAPPEVWHTPLFRRVNVVITAAWSLSFTLSAIAQAVIVAEGLGPVFSILVQIAGFALPARFTAAYPERARARFLQRSGTQLDIQRGIAA
ncbi:hypothetical protein ACIQU6_01585 [Streptomyces sp. NPDC090442]|uniref:hypothetical protein n=1 Tax=Streptomyces sp. NPDC090442 TaxID=3365962 RepID=UPI0037F13485